MNQEQDQLPLFSETPKPVHYYENFVCLDIECTGFNVETDDIIEIAAVKFNRTKKLETFHSLIKTNQQIPLIIQDLTGIKNSMLTEAPELEAVKDELLAFVGDLPIVGHNINFDLNFLESKGLIFHGKRIDTFPLSQLVINGCKSYSLETLSHFYSEHQPSHRALDDVLANIELLWHILKLWKERNTELSHNFLQKSELPFKDLLLQYPVSNKELTPSAKPEKTKSDKTKIIVCNQKQLNHLLEAEPSFQEIIPHYEQVSPEKWEEFQQKEAYPDEQATLGIKISLNQTADQLPRTTKLALHGAEYSFVNKLTKSKSDVDLSNPGTYLTTHRYFFQALEMFKGQEVEFANDPFLQEAFIRARSKYIRISDFPEEATITFGRLGIFYEKNAPKQESPLLLSDKQINSQDFQDILQALGQDLDYIPTAENDYIWLETRHGSTPKIGHLTQNTDYDLALLSEKYELDLTVKEPEEDQNLPLEIITKISEPNNFAYKNEITKQLEITIIEKDRDICILATSYEHIKHIFHYCLKHYPHRNVIAQQYSGSAGKIMHKLETGTDHNLLICTYQFYLKHKPYLPHLDRLFLTKLPISTPHHPFYVIQKQNNSQFFMEYVIPHAAANLYNSLSINSQCPNNYLLDKRLLTKSYGGNITSLCEDKITFVEQGK